MSGVCQRCGEPLPERTPGKSGRPRKWCSARCRQRSWEETVDVANCQDCGVQLTAGSRSKGYRLCWEHECARREREWLEVIEPMEAMWAEGRSLREIAAHFGKSISTVGVNIDRARKRWPGRFPHRYKRKAAA